MEEKWKIWDSDTKYGEIFYARATGQMPEMESSKAIAKKIKRIINKGDHILDVGCGGGHYLFTLDKILTENFKYTGLDATAFYIKKANDAFCSEHSFVNPYRLYTKFLLGDIYKMPIPDQYADIVMCSNVLLHLPSIVVPISELVRVAKKFIVIRTLIGNSSFRIKHIIDSEIYDLNGEPENYYYYNIYSESYITTLLRSNVSIKKFVFEIDNEFDQMNIGTEEYKKSGKEVPKNITKIINGMQVNHYVIQPWQFLIIEKS